MNTRGTRSGQPCPRRMATSASARKPTSICVVRGDGRLQDRRYRLGWFGSLSSGAGACTLRDGGVLVRHPDDDGATTARSRGLRPPWPPGQTGNPYGRVPLLTLAARVRRITDDGQALLDFYVAVLRGQPIPVTGRRAPLVPTLDQRMHAANWLADRGWGKCAVRRTHPRDPTGSRRCSKTRASRWRRWPVMSSLVQSTGHVRKQISHEAS